METQVVAEVIIPFAGDCVHRNQALEYVVDRHDLPIRITSGQVGRPWIKADAVMPAAEASTADIVVVADADCWTDGIPAAIDAVINGAPWAIPHDIVYRLTQENTTDLIRGDGEPRPPYARRPYAGVIGGGFVVLPRETLLAVPLDRRFVGWGQEDAAWAKALQTMTGTPWRGSADLTHLWHPPQPRMTKHKGSAASWKLLKRYTACGRDRAAMRKLLKEAGTCTC